MIFQKFTDIKFGQRCKAMVNG